MKLEITNFGSLQPKIASHLLNDNQAQVALNCRFEKGDLRAWKKSSKKSEITTDDWKSLYEYIEGSNSYWLYSTNDLDFAESPIAADAFERLYYTGESEPRAYAKDLVGSPFDQTTDYYKFGAAKPTTKLTVLGDQVTNGGFDTDTDWSKGTGWTISGGKADCDGSQTGDSDLSQDIGAVATHTYEVTFTISDYTAGTVTPKIGTTAGTARSSNGTYTETIVAQAATLYLTANVDFDGKIDDVIVTPYVTGSEYRAYVYTYVTRYGEETGPSPVESITDYGSGDVILGSFTQPPADYALRTKIGSNAPKIRVYRTNTSVLGAEFQYVDEFDIDTFNFTTGTFTDDVADADLGEVLPTEDYEGVPSGLKGLVGLSNGIFAGFVGNELYLSEPYLPHAWPDEYVMSFDFDIVGLGYFGTNLMVLTEGTPYLVYGATPEDMTKQRLQGFYPCVSKMSIANTPIGVLYSSYEGLVLINHNGPQNISLEYLTARDWLDYSPVTIRGGFYSGKYFGFYGGTGGFILDFEDKLFSTIEEYHKAQYLQVADGAFHLIRTDSQTGVTNIEEWSGDAYNYLYYTWKSKKFLLLQESGFTCAQLLIDTELYDSLISDILENEYIEGLNATIWAAGDLRDTFNYGDGTAANNMTFNYTEFNGSALYDLNQIDIDPAIKFILYVDNEKILERNITSDSYFKLPPHRGKRFEIQLSGYMPIRRFIMAQSPQELG